MNTVLITGANRGLGLEFCRHYLRKGWKVIATCRNPNKANSLIDLAESSSLDIHALDVQDEPSILRFAEQLSDHSIDLLINNAGVYGGSPQGIENIEKETWLTTLSVNTIAPFMLTRALLPLLRKGQQSKVAFLTSKMGSMEDNGSGRAYIYRSSKAALNAVIKSFSIDLAAEGIAVVALHPGWVRTDMGGPNGLISVEESINGLANVIDSLNATNSGRFLDYQGNEIPW